MCNPLPKMISAFLVGVGMVLLALKTMTAVVLFSDDPTTLLVLKSAPSWSNLLQDAQPSQYWIRLLSDENGFIGFTTYQLLVGHANTILTVLALLLGAVVFTTRHLVARNLGT